MKENKELIYTTERIELFPPVPEAPRPSSALKHPPRRRGVAGLSLGVAIFAMAFLLCDGVYALRQKTEQGEMGAWLSQLMSESFATTAPMSTDLPDQTTTPAITEQSTDASTSVTETQRQQTTAAESTVPPPPSLTAEQLYTYDSAAIPAGMIPIVPMDLSLQTYGESFYYNDTSYKLSLGDLPSVETALPASAKPEQVSVLILHTHATEGYSDEGATYYDPSTTLARADDPDQGVIAVGKVIAEILNARGIVTLHSTVQHDAQSYKDSYSRAAKTIQSYLTQYPSIRLVIDVHRDSILTSKDQLVRPVTVVNGEAVAQVMCVVGSDAAGGSYGHWRDNLSLAVGLRNALNADYGNICRPVYVKKSTYNQQYAPASLLLEIGSSGNTLAEARRAAALVADRIADMLT